MIFETSNYRQTLFRSLIDAVKVNGKKHIIVEDVERVPLNYGQFILKCFALGRILSRNTKPKEYVGVLLPGTIATAVVFFALQSIGRVAAMLNFTVGADGLVKACQTGELRQVYTSRRFVEAGKLEEVIEAMSEVVEIIYLEDLKKQVRITDKLAALSSKWFPELLYNCKCGDQSADDPAVILFTSGSEGTPKGVVLSHANIQANRVQLSAKIDFNRQDVVLNVLPLFHSFGLTVATILPILSGVKVFFYPSPLHYRIVPEIAYDINATLLFGTNTFLKGYSGFAHPYDFYSLRYVFAGAEKLQEETKRMWSDKYGIRIFEGYGATETSPVLSMNTPMECKPGSVGRFVPSVEYHLEPVPGIEGGGRLYVKGSNIMQGYLKHDNPGVIQPPVESMGEGWYDTGDIVEVDAEGYVFIKGRAKRFAKVGGEMVSLTFVESLASECWPDAMSAVVTVPDEKKGEKVILVVETEKVDRAEFMQLCRSKGVGEINIPGKFITTNEIPVLGTGKINYVGLQCWVNEQILT
jgi:acyl-[acyl-carrier-protein]-phospholipid O-acyltransferase / long-chain-fatty-acid--[acyl-carrier-protein] ligase